MFKLFERQPNWALKQLVQETDQPAVCFLAFYCSIFLTRTHTHTSKRGEMLEA